jgi:hypothetical protein
MDSLPCHDDEAMAAQDFSITTACFKEAWELPLKECEGFSQLRRELADHFYYMWEQDSIYRRITVRELRKRDDNVKVEGVEMGGGKYRYVIYL